MRVKSVFQLMATGVIMMMTTNAIGARSFNLKAASEYFNDDRTVAVLKAALDGDLTRAQLLVSKGANPNDEGPRNRPYNRIRPLHYAIAANNQQAVKVLLAVGADPEMTVTGYGPAILFTMTLRNIDMLRLLLDLRPIKTLSKDTLEDLLFEGTDYCPQCFDLLLQRGMPIDFPDGAGYTILMREMDGYHFDLAEWLIQKGASVHVEAKSGMTPAYSVQYDLQRFKPGSPTYSKVLHLKKLMEERGAVFPAATPEQVRARRAAKR